MTLSKQWLRYASEEYRNVVDPKKKVLAQAQKALHSTRLDSSVFRQIELKCENLEIM